MDFEKLERKKLLYFLYMGKMLQDRSQLTTCPVVKIMRVGFIIVQF